MFTHTLLTLKLRISKTSFNIYIYFFLCCCCIRCGGRCRRILDLRHHIEIMKKKRTILSLCKIERRQVKRFNWIIGVYNIHFIFNNASVKNMFVDSETKTKCLIELTR